MRGIFISLLSIFLFWAPAGSAQNVSWVQIESHSSLQTAQNRARAYGSVLTGLNGFELGLGWYTLALGPFDEATAQATLRRLRNEGVIPRDSFLSDGAAYSNQFWPIGGSALTAAPTTSIPTPTPEAPAPAPAPAQTVAEAQAEASPTPAPAEPEVEPEETRRQALQSERALNRDERKDLQIALQWFGFYTAGIDGAFGPGTRRSMSAWQVANDLEDTGVLTTRQRAQLLADYADALAILGLDVIRDDVAGIEIEAPMGLVQFDRYEAPFAHYAPRDDSGVRMILISQSGDRSTMNGLYEILQTLDIVPTTGPRSKARDRFSIRGEGADITSETRVRLRDGHIHGFILIWPPAQEGNIGRVLPKMESSLRSVGPAMDPVEGFDPAQQDIDLVSGLQLRKPDYSRSGVFVDQTGRVVTSPEVANGCSRLTINQLHDAEVVFSNDAMTLIAPTERLAPVATASFAQTPARLRSAVSVAGFPYEGILGAATLTYGTLEDLKGLDGSADVLRLGLTAQTGDAGGPVFDQSGAVAGILLPAPSGSQALPANVAFAAKAGNVSEALATQGIATTTATSDAAMAPEDLTLLAADMTVLVSCWN